ncbi:hypothetical protein C2G38_2214223 [Gigaspora rosea]|uniref:Uncharacterized protein n=1 Tax=Gigaspora rosea TaxID=44941 RepID=A0A397UB77_9GLOM|nr:hypothetical protein C2G38_2214223 [Gigaspora rosea]
MGFWIWDRIWDLELGIGIWDLEGICDLGFGQDLGFGKDLGFGCLEDIFIKV